jgi:uncharacterized membrane protein YkvA (DUF1232 family)
MTYNEPVLDRLKERARAVKTETHAVYLAALDPRTPWSARVLILLVVAYALSPIDLIPDFVPILGYLDDLILIPAGISLALRLIPPKVMDEARQRARAEAPGRALRVGGTAIIILLWIVAIIAIVTGVRLAQSKR